MIERPAPLIAIALLLAMAGLAPAAEEKRIVKEKRADGSLVLDESGLTQGFEQMLKMMQTLAQVDTESGAVVVTAPRVPQIGVDWIAASELLSEEGRGLLELQTSPPFKLRTEAEIVFEGARIAPGNITPGFAGLYSLWIERTGADSWELIFNSQPDVWGSMHDPAFDVARTPLQHQLVELKGSPMLRVQVESSADDASHTLEIRWGTHSWTTSFVPAPASD